MLSAKDFLWLALAAGWLLLVLFLGYVLVKLGGVLKSTEELVDGVTERTVPLLGEVTTSVVQVNGQLERVDTITGKVQDMTTNLASLTALFAATLGGPLVKVAAFSYGVRRASSRRAKADLESEIKSRIKADKRSAKAARKAPR